jgi:hypothetical protein
MRHNLHACVNIPGESMTGPPVKTTASEIRGLIEANGAYAFAGIRTAPAC